jgi:hypothetical protein
VHCHVHARKLKHIPFTSISLRKYQMTTANVLPAIVKYRDFHKWASIVEQAGKCMRASLDFHSSFIKYGALIKRHSINLRSICNPSQLQ